MTQTPDRAPRWFARTGAVLTALVMALGLAAPAGAQTPPLPGTLLPVVFVHGNSGSAQQFQTQFQRFTSNGYPQELLYAYEYDTSGPSNDAAVAGLTEYVDDVLAETGRDQVLLAAHSRGTTVSHAWLATPANAEKVAKYVNLDGRSAPSPPGGVDTLAIWGEWNSPPNPTRGGEGGAIVGADNRYNRDFGHTEAVSAPRTFAAMWEFFLGEPPVTTEILAERGRPVTIAGRAVLFPQNVGFEGAFLQVWPVDAATGHRTTARPIVTYTIDASGDFGPLQVDPRQHYEFALVRPGGTVHHFYSSPFVRDDLFLRLNSGREGQGLEAFTFRDERHTTMTITRAREMWGDQGAGSDRLTVDVLGDDVPPLDVLTPATAPRTGPGGAGGNTGEVNALFLFDVGAPRAPSQADPRLYEHSDQQTDLGKGVLAPFSSLTFLNAADVYLPAAPGGTGTVRLSMTPRGGADPEVLAVPNWPSTTDRITVHLRDWTSPAPQPVQPRTPQATAAGRGIEDACTPGAQPSPRFPDVPATFEHAPSITCVARYGIARGYTDGRFGPLAPVTRGQMAAFVARAVQAGGGVLPLEASSVFGDDDGSVHELAINRLAAVGIVQGYGDGTFRPDAPVSRAEMSSFLVRAYEHVTGVSLTPGSGYFTDTGAVGQRTDIDRAAGAGLTAGVRAGVYDPAGLTTRGQMATFLARLLDLLVEDGTATVR